MLAISADATDLTGGRLRRRPDPRGDRRQRGVRHVPGGRPRARALPSGSARSCDAEIQPNPDPIGLYEVARVYGPDDPHCCPSAISERVLTWNGTRFVVASEETTEL